MEDGSTFGDLSSEGFGEMTLIFFIGEECLKSLMECLSLALDSIKDHDGAKGLEILGHTVTCEHGLTVIGNLLV